MGKRHKKAESASSVLRKRYYAGKPRHRIEQAEAAMSNMALGDKIRMLREHAGLTQAQLAAQIGTQPSQISRIEDADYDGHSVDTLRRIANALHAKLKIEFVEDGSQTHNLQPV
ncbi:MAG TPA: helix-turn-helix transcriptional regulator [Tepidisphaeraceae bacterium]